MRRLGIIFTLCLYVFGSQLMGQQRRSGGESFTIEGNVYDQTAHVPMEYTTISLLSKDSTLIEGTITDAKGSFTIRTNRQGNYILKAGFIGYDRFTQNVQLNPQNPTVVIDEIILHPSSSQLEEVRITAQKSTMEYKIDKKVVHVGDNLAAVSGNAADVLANVPSVSVDIEGNVSLRGNSNFKVLIDDRPTVLDANEALQQIPASTIQDIEIITNPSAKYDPEGTAGIINIITKKRSLEGISGIVNLDAGLDEKYGADILLNYRTQKFNYFIGGDYSDRMYPGTVENVFKTFDGDTTTARTSDGNYRRIYNRYNIRGGIEWFPTQKTNMRLSGNYGYREWGSSSITNYRTWSEVSGEIQRENIYSNSDKMSRAGDYYSINFDFSKEFSSREHKLDIELMYMNRGGDENSRNTLLNDDNDTISSQRSTESGPAGGYNYRINYKQPFSTAFKIEAGIQGRSGEANEENRIYYYDLQQGIYELQELLSHDVNYMRSYNGIYGLVSGELENVGVGYQVGLRAENTDRLIELDDTGEQFEINRWDFFPTLHFSYQLSEENQLMASYTRRIDRPRGWNFEPFLTWSDAYNVRRGNPALKPEYINAYEIAYLKDFNDNSFSTELFWRTTNNEIEGIRTAYNDSVTLRTYENIGTDRAIGMEMMLNLDIVERWETNLTGEFFNYRVWGSYDDETFDRSSFSWEIRWNNIINIGESTRIQLNPGYEGPEKEAQEEETGYFIAHGAIRQSFMNNKFDLTLQVRDIFSTGKHESEINESDLYSYRLYRHKAPMVMLNFTWRINNYRSQNGRGGGEDMGGEGMD